MDFDEIMCVAYFNATTLSSQSLAIITFLILGEKLNRSLVSPEGIFTIQFFLDMEQCRVLLIFACVHMPAGFCNQSWCPMCMCVPEHFVF